MTTRALASDITRKIADHYAMQAGDIDALKQQISAQLTIVYRKTIQAQLTLYGCQTLASATIDPESQRWIDAKALKDAEGIAATYNRELVNRVERIRKDNPRANRFFYMRELDTWLNSRTPRKTSSIALNTMTAARKYAQDRFVQENNIKGKWVLVGPPPVCRKCVRIKALGAVTFETTQKANNALPQHANCPHQWGQLVPKKIDCDDMTWTG